MTRVAWVLNLDADLELAAGAGYTPTKGALTAMAPYVAMLERMLVGPGEGVVGIATGAGWSGRAFCPTPRAIAAMRAAGVEPEAHPTFEVLRRVNGRAFCAALGQTLPGAAFVRSFDEAAALVSRAPGMPAKQWRAKRAFGMAGRGQRPIAPGMLNDSDAQFLRASIERDDGIQIEPALEIVRELALHGLIADDTRVGRLVEQRCDATGQWLESIALDDDLPALRAEAERVAAALREAGYFGPFGVDAFEYADGAAVRLNVRSEINARYSMGFAASGLLRTR